MNLNKYQALANRTAKSLPTTIDDLMHAQIGMTTEVGEFATTLKKMSIYGQPMTVEKRNNLIEELGDLMWYVALAATALQGPLDFVAQHNVDKLMERYPDKYSDELAAARLDKNGAED